MSISTPLLASKTDYKKEREKIICYHFDVLTESWEVAQLPNTNILYWK